MKILAYLALALLSCQPRLADRHWCEQPIRKLRWLNQMIRNAQSWPTYHYGWEVHQARYRGREVFILHLCQHCGQSRGFILYNHQGELIGQGEGADSVWVAKLTHDRLLAAHSGRFMVVR